MSKTSGKVRPSDPTQAQVVTTHELRASVATLGELIQQAHTARHAAIDDKLLAFMRARETFHNVVTQATSDYEQATAQVCQSAL